MSDELTPAQKAHRTAKWARTVTKWRIKKYSTAKVQWTFVECGGVNGAESRGVVDILAIRKDHRMTNGPLKRGDLLDIVLVQTKGGRSPRPSHDEIERLVAVAEHHRARTVVLSVWKKAKELSLYQLIGHTWKPVEPADVFK